MSNISVDLINHNNDELLVVNAARVSMNKHHDTFEEESDTRLLTFLLTAKPHTHWTPLGHPQIVVKTVLPWREIGAWVINSTPGHSISIEESDRSEACFYQRGSLWFWINPENQTIMPFAIKKAINTYIFGKYPVVSKIIGITDFEDKYRINNDTRIISSISDNWVSEDNTKNRSRLVTATFRVTVPLAIKVHLFKHKYGFVESEISRRYVSSDLEFVDKTDWIEHTEYFCPDGWRMSSPKIKQGSLDTLSPYSESVDSIYRLFTNCCRDMYNDFVHKYNIAPEQARFIQPMGSLTSFYWTGTLLDLKRFFSLRYDDHSQREVRFVAEIIDKHVETLFPRSWNFLKGL